ncbi:50S ribosomal protein L15, chloroplastic-like [Lolium rigidum]|uniref:50S ribosomal protein L15, chloroplastic-like n=1 Tax=Lolium rigidum TaxID=89674 RepID=UPI001F5DA5F6|nr:50S ribosomal protein L15, chloroplastic-like [Lolium rigidum]
MASITLLTLAPGAAFLHLPASTTSSSSHFAAIPRSLTGRRALPLRARVTVVCTAAAAAEAAPVEKFALDNLSPQKGSRRKPKRKGRGISAGQGASCGFGMRGQKSRSGPGVRRGFEGGQMPLYRRLPKLRGIAGGMHIGLPKYVPFNLRDIAQGGFKDGEEISLESLKSKGLINPSGRERKLPLKILGDGDVSVKLNIKAGAFSSSAKEKLEAAGCTLTVLPKRKKWLPAAYVKNQARAEEYFKKKNGGAGEPDTTST